MPPFVIKAVDEEETEYHEFTHDVYNTCDWDADLIIYQAGMDCHQNDPFGSPWLTTELLEKREELVFSLAKKHKIPLLFVLAGGYQALPDLVPLHLKTFEMAYMIYY